MKGLPMERIELGDGDYLVTNKYLLKKTQTELARITWPLVKDISDPIEQIKALAPVNEDLLRIVFCNQVETLSMVTSERRRLIFLSFDRVIRKTLHPPFDWAVVKQLFSDTNYEKLDIVDREMNRLYAVSPLDVKS